MNSKKRGKHPRERVSTRHPDIKPMLKHPDQPGGPKSPSGPDFGQSIEDGGID